MFLFKKLLAPFFFPLPLCLAFLGLGLMLLWFTRRQRAGRTLVTLGTLLWPSSVSAPSRIFC